MNSKVECCGKLVRVISRERFKHALYAKLSETGDPLNMKPTFERSCGTILECRVDNRVMATNKDGVDCVLLLMGAHVYTCHNKELLQVVRECFEESEQVTEKWLGDNNKDKEYILELDENDKRILATN
mgnify:CR=1 FL=1